jgi:hypothetical protein
MRHYFILVLCVCFSINVAAAHAASISEMFDEASTILFEDFDGPGPETMCCRANCAEKAPAHLDYWYHGYCKDMFPDFAALAVFEDQSCPQVQKKNGDSLCVSRYRIIRVLDAASDTLRKEHITVKEKSLLPQFRYRPILIFGKYTNGTIQIKGYEDVREYFSPFINWWELSWINDDLSDFGHEDLNRVTDFGSTDLTQYDIYAFHSIGTPYYNANTLDSMERMYYNEYLIPAIKIRLENAGKDFNKLWRCLTQNRTKVKAAPIKNDFAALGAIKNMRVVENFQQTKMCVLDIVLETIIKNKTNVSPNITMCKYGDCPSINTMLKQQYLFGDFKRNIMVIDTFIPTNDIFVFGDTIYNISMGFPFVEFLEYFLPSDLSVVEEESAHYFRPKYMNNILPQEIRSVNESLPEEQKKFIEAAILKENRLMPDLRKKQEVRWYPPKNKVYAQQFGYRAVIREFNRYRCRNGGRNEQE